MTKKKRLISMFAVMLIAIFSVGCVFAAACGKKDEEEPEAEHVHEYTKVNYDNENHWYECSADDGAVDESTVAPHNWDEGTQTTDPTCGDEGVMTYKCECGATKTESVDPTGEHTFTKVVFTWTEDAENGGYTATASLTCEVCGTVDSENADVSADVTSEVNADGDTVYTAKVTIGEKEYEDEKIVEAEKDTTGSSEGFAITLGKTSVSLSETATSEQISVSITLDGAAYTASSDEGNIYVSTSDAGIANVSEDIANGYITVSTSAVSGTATVTVAVVDPSEPKTEIVSESITVIVTGVGPDTVDMESGSITFTESQKDAVYETETSLLEEDGISVSVTAGSATTQVEGKEETEDRSVSIDSNSKTDPRKTGDEAKYSYRLKLGGAGTADYRSIKIETEGTAVIRFAMYGSNSSYANIRTAEFYKYVEDGEDILMYTDADVRGFGDLVIWTVSVSEAGTYYMTSKDGGINIYAIDVLYAESSASVEHVHVTTVAWNWESDYSSATATFTCTADGCDWTNNEYTVTSDKIAITENVTTAATCGTAGSKTCTATITGTTYSDTKDEIVIPATGNHTLEKTAAVEATCDTEGNNDYWTCSVCDSVFSDGDGTQETTVEDQIISATGHTYVAKYLTVGADNVYEDGWYLVCSVCQDVTDLVEGTPYDFAVTSAVELKAALGINNAVITLQSDIEGAFTVTGTGINLDLNGHSITYTYVAADDDEAEEALDTITVASDASITIEDNGGNETNAVIKNTYTTGTSHDNAAAIFTEGTLVINGGKIESSSVGIRAQAGTVTINGGEIESDYFSVWMDKGVVTVTINGGTITGDRKGIFVEGDANFGYPDLEDEDGEGGLKYNWQTGAVTTLIVTGGTITSKQESAISTYGVASVESAVVEISGGTITSDYTIENFEATTTQNDSVTFIPAIFFPSGTLTISGGTVSGATALEVKGGTATISGGTFTSTVDVTNDPSWKVSGAVSYGYAFAAFPYGETQRSYDNENDAYTNADDTFDNTLNLTISGGMFDGIVYFYDIENGAYTDSYGQELEYTYSVTGGTYKYTKGLEDFLAEGYGFNSWCNGYYEVTEGAQITRVYNFMDQDWTSTLVKADDGTIVVDSVISMKGTGEEFAFGQYGLVTGAQSATGDYYVAMDLSAYSDATSVNVSIQFGNSGDTGDSNVILLYSSQIAYGQWSAMGASSSMGKVSKSVYSYGSIPAVLEYDVNFEHLTNGMLYLEWQARTTYIYSITITVVE